MNAVLVQDFINNVLKEMWPKWAPTDWQIKFWKKTLERCNFEASKRSLESWYAEADRPGREPILGVFNKIKCLEAGWKRTESEPKLLFALAPLVNLTKKRNFLHPIRPADYVIEEMAERHRAKAEELYGGDWVVIRLWESKPVDYEDNGLRGMAARKAVEKVYLDGPDCPEKRFVESGIKMRDCIKTVDNAIAPPKCTIEQEG